MAYVRFAAVFSGVLGVLHQTRLALRGAGSQVHAADLKLREARGQVRVCLELVPRMGYRAVILCESPLIWCVMAVYLVLAFLQILRVYSGRAT